jgi:hypothetical protein
MHLLRVFVSLNALLAAAIWTGVIIWLVGLALSVGYPTVARYTINLGLGLWVLLPLAIAPSIMAMFLWDRRLQFVPHLHPPLGLALVGMAGVTEIDVTLTLCMAQSGAATCLVKTDRLRALDGDLLARHALSLVSLAAAVARLRGRSKEQRDARGPWRHRHGLTRTPGGRNYRRDRRLVVASIANFQPASRLPAQERR